MSYHQPDGLLGMPSKSGEPTSPLQASKDLGDVSLASIGSISSDIHPQASPPHVCDEEILDGMVVTPTSDFLEVGCFSGPLQELPSRALLQRAREAASVHQDSLAIRAFPNGLPQVRPSTVHKDLSPVSLEQFVSKCVGSNIEDSSDFITRPIPLLKHNFSSVKVLDSIQTGFHKDQSPQHFGSKDLSNSSGSTAQNLVPFHNIPCSMANTVNVSAPPAWSSFLKPTSSSLSNLSSPVLSYSQVSTPKVVEDSIPLMGSSQDCGVMVERLRNSYLDDYAMAMEAVTGKKSIIFIGQAPDDHKYLMAFLASPALVKKLVNQGIRVKGTWLCVTHIQEPATKIIVSGVLPFIRDEDILDACKAFGKPVYPKLRRIPAGTRSHQFNGILSFRRELHLILEKDTSLPDNIAIFSHGKVHKLSLSTIGLTCYRCSKPGHLATNCRVDLSIPNQNSDSMIGPPHITPKTLPTPPFRQTLQSCQPSLPPGASPISNFQSASLDTTSKPIDQVITSPLLITSSNPNGEWVLVKRNKKTSQAAFSSPTTAVTNPSTKTTSSSSTSMKTVNSSCSASCLGSSQLQPLKSPLLGPCSFSSRIPDSSCSQVGEDCSDEASEDPPDQEGIDPNSQAKDKRKRKKKRKSDNKRRKSLLNDVEDEAPHPTVTLSQNEHGEDEEAVHIGTKNPAPPLLVTSKSPSMLTSKEKQTLSQNKHREHEELVHKETKSPTPPSLVTSKSPPMSTSKGKQRLDPNLCLAVTNSLLDKLKFLKTAKRRAVMEEFDKKYPLLLQMVESAQPKLIKSKPGDYIGKSIHKIKDEIKSLNKPFSRRVVMNHNGE